MLLSKDMIQKKKKQTRKLLTAHWLEDFEMTSNVMKKSIFSLSKWPWLWEGGRVLTSKVWRKLTKKLGVRVKEEKLPVSLHSLIFSSVGLSSTDFSSRSAGCHSVDDCSEDDVCFLNFSTSCLGSFWPFSGFCLNSVLFGIKQWQCILANGQAERRLSENLQCKNAQNGSGSRHPKTLSKSKILLDPFKITPRLMLGGFRFWFTLRIFSETP